MTPGKDRIAPLMTPLDAVVGRAVDGLGHFLNFSQSLENGQFLDPCAISMLGGKKSND